MRKKNMKFEIDGVIAISTIIGWFMFLIGLAVGRGL